MRQFLLLLLAGLTACSTPAPPGGFSFIGSSEADVLAAYGQPTSRSTSDGATTLSYARRSNAFSTTQVQLAPMGAATALGSNVSAGPDMSASTLVCDIAFHIAAGRVVSVSQSGPGCGV